MTACAIDNMPVLPSRLQDLRAKTLPAAKLLAETQCKVSLAHLTCCQDVGDDAGPALFCDRPVFWTGFAEALVVTLAALGAATPDAVAARCCSTLHSIGPCAVAELVL